ncbi:MAG: ABC transporter permease subunit [Spirochaetaceae bacterium]|jgi:putative aldouronate transport system permease protein|nr:ABC transporter permease subunit [Spirochaetaceae bacterium]
MIQKKHSFFADIRRNPFSYCLVLPAAIYVLLFSYLTLPYMLMAFQNYHFQTGLFHSPWVGLKNFAFFFKSNRAGLVTWNTIWLNFLFITSGTVGSVVLALMLNEVRQKRYLKVTQSLMLFPNFLSWIIVAYIVYAFLSTGNGWLYQIIESFGGKPVSMYSKASYWPPILVIIKLWKGVGMNSVIYMASMTGIDEGLYEAARIDGANKFQEIRHITLPLIMPTVCIMTLLAVGKIFYGDFQMIYALVGDNGILMQTTDVIDTYVFRALRQTGDPSGAMAVGVYQAFVGFIMVYGSNWLVKKNFPDGAIF